MIEPLMVFARLLQYAGAVILGGAPLFFLYGLPGADGRAVIERGWPRAALLFASLAILVGGAAALSIETANMSGTPGDAFRPVMIWSVLQDTAFGHGMAVRLALSLLALPIAVASPWRGRGYWRWRLLALLGAGVLASFAWTGHGGADDGAAGLIHRGADVVHLYAAGVWLGALAVLSALLIGREAQADAAVLHRALQRFSGVGTLIVALLIVSGLVNSWFLVGPDRVLELVRTGYGLTLLAKLALFAAMLALAAHNRFNLTPRLGRAAAGSPRDVLVGLRRSVVAETGLAGLVLLSVAVLGMLAPPAAG